MLRALPAALVCAFAFGGLGACDEHEEPSCDGGECRDAQPMSVVYELIDGAVTAVTEDRACAMQSTTAMPGLDKQVDILFVIDNSGSMTEEIAAVRDNINQSFTRIIEESGVDYRVLMLSRYGWSGTEVCIEPPLAGAPCADGLYVTNGERFFHYNWPIDSMDPWCKLLASLDARDPEGRAPNGLREWLRPNAEKVIVMITDDSAGCAFAGPDGAVRFGGEGADPFTDALRFHETLLAVAPEQFGSASAPRYAFYAIVGMPPKEPATDPYFPHEGLEDEPCDTAPSPGQAYQALSIATDALRYPVCEGRGFDAVFRVLARSVLDTAKADCSFQLPVAPKGQAIDRVTVNVEYTPSDGSAPRRIRRVEDSTRCDVEGFVLAGDRIELCRDACDVVEADRGAALRVLYGCTVIPK